eukprot:Skav216653  [mRNA]  locus=scaffold1255:408235:411273:- [translate_table: standard]
MGAAVRQRVQVHEAPHVLQESAALDAPSMPVAKTPSKVLPDELTSLLPKLFATDLSTGPRPAVPSWRLGEYLSGRDAFVYLGCDQEFGNEARGVSKELLALAHECSGGTAERRLRIPMVPGIDSLNVGVSVGVVLHEALGAAVRRRSDGKSWRPWSVASPSDVSHKCTTGG